MNNNIQWGKEVYPYIISVLDPMNTSRDYARNIKGNTGQRQDELNFGTGTPDVGFILNTFDFKNPVSVVGPFQGYKKGGRLTINNTKMNNKSRITIVK